MPDVFAELELHTRDLVCDAMDVGKSRNVMVDYRGRDKLQEVGASCAHVPAPHFLSSEIRASTSRIAASTRERPAGRSLPSSSVFQSARWRIVT